MKNSENYICVFCSSSDAINDQYFQVAKELGVIMVERKYNLIHGAGKIGLMGEISRSVKRCGGSVIGVIPEALNKKGITSEIDDEVIVTKDMHERKKTMFEKADAFIALPGGFGTLEEVIEIITLKQLRYHQKPIVFLNINKFFSSLFEQFEVFFKENFAKPEYAKLYHIADNSKDALDYIEKYRYETINDKWFD